MNGQTAAALFSFFKSRSQMTTQFLPSRISCVQRCCWDLSSLNETVDVPSAPNNLVHPPLFIKNPSILLVDLLTVLMIVWAVFLCQRTFVVPANPKCSLFRCSLHCMFFIVVWAVKLVTLFLNTGTRWLQKQSRWRTKVGIKAMSTLLGTHWTLGHCRVTSTCRYKPAPIPEAYRLGHPPRPRHEEIMQQVLQRWSLFISQQSILNGSQCLLQQDDVVVATHSKAGVLLDPNYCSF